ncbi:hypothetical protein EA762_03885 [Acinetobacter pittii]|uniref:hypothetical protein n=1 Tax=Acinetobacter TaxID=469 RepID=UPI0002E92B0F|nr:MULTISPECIES: hypothetical protein [Acinetobacter]RSO20890.1 hypothetical protein EA762_03885 [Acinetobacter pittii]
MGKRLKDFMTENRKPRPPSMSQVVPMQFGDDEASMRVMMHAANRVISRHLVELKKLAYK